MGVGHARHYLTFTFPYSHGLIPLVATPLFSAIAYWLDRRRVVAFTSPRQTFR